MPILNDEDQACLTSCMDEIRDVVGESVSERQLVDTIMKFKFDCAKSLDAILNHTTTPPSAKTSSASAPKQPIETGDHPHLFEFIALKTTKTKSPIVHQYLFDFLFSFLCSISSYRFGCPTIPRAYQLLCSYYAR